MDTALTKADILTAYRKVRKKLQKKPNYEQFCKLSGVSKLDVLMNYRTYSNLVEKAGDKPTLLMTKVYSVQEYIDSYVKYIREHKSIPNTMDWKFNSMTPRAGTYTHRFKKQWNEIPLFIYSLIKDKIEYKDVKVMMEEICGFKKKLDDMQREEELMKDKRIQKKLFINNLDEVLKRTTPPGVHDLIWLSRHNTTGKDFEDRCGLVLRLLGFDVSKYGQGSGRKPDGVAEDPINRYAIIYDAKSRRYNYTTGTDDRLMIEYIREERKRLMAHGYEVVYFLVISSEFGRISPESIFNVRSETGVSPSFITAENLLHLLAKKIENPREVDTGTIKRLFVPGGEIRKEEI
jgi:hypothetical protein